MLLQQITKSVFNIIRSQTLYVIYVIYMNDETADEQTVLMTGLFQIKTLLYI